MMEDRRSRVVVAGGGIAGLATAYHLLRLAEAAGWSVDVALYEAGPRCGGKIVTERFDGFVIEGGPDSFLTTKPAAIELCRALGLGDRLIPTRPENRAVYVYAGDRLHPIPDGLRLIAPTRLVPFLRSDLISWPGKVRMALDVVIPPRRDASDESIGAFVRRRLGREALAKLGEPMMAGIFVGDPDRLSLQATFPRFVEMERRHGGVIRGARAAARAAVVGGRAATTGMRRGPGPGRGSAAGPPAPPMFMNLAGGSAELTDALAAALGPAVVRTGRGVAAVAPSVDDPHRFNLTLTDGAAATADAVVLATPAPVAARLLAPWRPDLSRRVAAIRHLSTATVSLGFRRADVPHALDGSGFVVAREPGDPTRIVACTWSSSKYAHRAPADAVLVRAFVGGHGREADVELGDAALVDLVRRDLGRILGIEAPPAIERVYRWRGANPQYEVGHLERVAAIDRACPAGVYLTGAAYHGVGVPDCVAAAERTAGRLLADLGAAGGTGRPSAATASS